MERLLKLGYKCSHNGAYTRYILEMEGYKIVITKNHSGDNWMCLLIRDIDGNYWLKRTHEIVLSTNCEYEWLVKLTKILDNH